MTWWDHETGSIWSQPLGEAIIGPLKGSMLDVVPSTLTTWEAWRGAHPETLALDVHAWRTAFDLADMAIITDFGTETVAYSVPHLREVGLVNDVVAGLEIASGGGGISISGSTSITIKSSALKVKSAAVCVGQN